MHTALSTAPYASVSMMRISSAGGGSSGAGKGVSRVARTERRGAKGGGGGSQRARAEGA